MSKKLESVVSLLLSIVVCLAIVSCNDASSFSSPTAPRAPGEPGSDVPSDDPPGTDPPPMAMELASALYLSTKSLSDVLDPGFVTSAPKSPIVPAIMVRSEKLYGKTPCSERITIGVEFTIKVPSMDSAFSIK